ncbi:hypothetical protein [Pseudanabaena sp. FACHB-2040]|uniref:hypothetical protein n=1 Tax=Pseudanabaena sp. FACHB-2040 TaxID=2692859 RepID=UPI0016896CDD|nr:hypothetical protein [Pseudanabaena sp. FACHB-2040]MBD2261250.1 hypothetical protein [Pseudanabaena sp. FACHB-2040]
MVENQSSGSDRSIRVGGNAIGSAIVTGGSNTVSVEFKQASLPEAEAVDFKGGVLNTYPFLQVPKCPREVPPGWFIRVFHLS